MDIDINPIPSNIMSRLDNLYEQAMQVESRNERYKIHSLMLQIAVEATQLTSAYLAQWDAQNRSSQVVAEFISKQSNVKERQSDLGETYPEPDDTTLPLWMAGENPPTRKVFVYDLSEKINYEEYLKYGAGTILYVAVKSGGRSWGYMELWESRYNRDFRADESRLYQTIADYIAKSLLP